MYNIQGYYPFEKTRIHLKTHVLKYKLNFRNIFYRHIILILH